MKRWDRRLSSMATPLHCSLAAGVFRHVPRCHCCCCPFSCCCPAATETGPAAAAAAAALQLLRCRSRTQSSSSSSSSSAAAAAAAAGAVSVAAGQQQGKQQQHQQHLEMCPTARYEFTEGEHWCSRRSLPQTSGHNLASIGTMSWQCYNGGRRSHLGWWLNQLPR